VQKRKILWPLNAFQGHLFFSLIFSSLTSLLSAQSTWSTTNCLRSQKQASVWYFGNKAGINFLSGTAVADTTQNVMRADKGSAVICDSMGNLQFFTNGDKVWDRTFTLMPNATDLNGSQFSTQPCVIVPRPGDPSYYYLFTVDFPAPLDSVNYKTKGLCLTLIDMSRRNGLGDAPSEVLNKPILSPVAAKITAVKHRNGNDYWVIVHEYGSDRFYSYKITGADMEDPVISAVGSIHEGRKLLELNNAIGYLKASPDGSKLAVAIPNKKVIELLDFNNETGEVTNPRSFSSSVPGINPYGLEFSPDSRMLYATILDIGGVLPPPRPSYIFQFDLKTGLSNPMITDSIAGIRMLAMQLAVDGRIYISRSNNIKYHRDSLDVIYNPNRPGQACNLNSLNNIPESRFYPDGRKSIFSMPNFVQSFVNIPTFTWDSVCHNDATNFRITNDANIDSLQWNFGDGADASGLAPVHAYANPGKYKVILTEYFNGTAYQDSMTVTNYKLPQLSLVDTILLYKGSSINLHAGGGFMEYLWSTKSTDSIITVDTEGSYSARVKDYNCCVNTDTTYVKVFEYFIPNAFSPNGDLLNDIFKVNGLYKNINFRMIVYDRWGRLIFESDDIDKGWDGKFGGTYCEPDAYVWVVTISFKGDDIVTEGDIKFKGTITLVR
jgi:gliding motility-associated-like protein